MRNRKELIYLNIKDLTQKEIEELGNLELNCCDNCGEIELSEKLNWIDGEYFWKDLFCISLVVSGFVALCDKCFDQRETHLAQCGSCEKYFIVCDDKDKDCTHCGSDNWTYGCIDEISAKCFNCKGKADCELEVYQDCKYNPANKVIPDN